MALELENDPLNPCIGCGPRNPLGLHLRFAREADRVTTTLRVEEHHQGWPGRLHSGVLYLALLEVANWSLFGLQGRAGIPIRTGALEAKRWVGLGETLTLTGRVTKAEKGRATVRAEAASAERGLAAALERDYELPTEAEFLARMGYDRVPAGFEGAFPP